MNAEQVDGRLRRLLYEGCLAELKASMILLIPDTWAIRHVPSYCTCIGSLHFHSLIAITRSTLQVGVGYRQDSVKQILLCLLLEFAVGTGENG